MKKIIFLFCVVWVWNPMWAVAQKTMKDVLTQVETRESLPYLYKKMQPLTEKKHGLFDGPTNEIVDLTGIDLGGVQRFMWTDLQCTGKWSETNDRAVVHPKILPANSKYVLADLHFFAAAAFIRRVLATYTPDGQFIDQLESVVSDGVRGQGRLCLKQFRVDPDMTVTIYELKVDSKVPLNFWDQFESLSAQRIDTKYKIDDTGHFRKVSEVSYQPKTYSIAELTDPAKNIWDGTETIIK